MTDEQERRKRSIDWVSRSSGYGSISAAQTDNLWGLSTNLTGPVAPTNRETYGYTFFTRPDMNLSYDNLSQDRIMSIMGTAGPKTLAGFIRATLDPRAQNQFDRVDSPMCDAKQAFIPLLSNNLINLPAFPDNTIQTYTSPEGNYRESQSMVDGTSLIYNTYELTANFQNIQGDPINLMFYIWTRYAGFVYDGTMVPYPDNISNMAIDYNTRIYRLATNERRTHVNKIASCGAAFPTNDNMGSAFNFSREENFNSERSQVSINFQCDGAEYIDPILIVEFNWTVQYFNPDMVDQNRNDLMKQISRFQDYPPFGAIGDILMNALSHRVYPRVDPYTLELQWWASRNDYEITLDRLATQGVIRRG